MDFNLLPPVPTSTSLVGPAAMSTSKPPAGSQRDEGGRDDRVGTDPRPVLQSGAARIFQNIADQAAEIIGITNEMIVGLALPELSRPIQDTVRG